MGVDAAADGVNDVVAAGARVGFLGEAVVPADLDLRQPGQHHRPGQQERDEQYVNATAEQRLASQFRQFFGPTWRCGSWNE